MADSFAKLVVKLEAESSKLTSELEKTRGQLKRFKQDADGLTSGIKNAFGGIKSALGGIAGIAAGAFALDSLKDLVQGSLDAADNLRDLANRFGSTAEQMGALDYAAKLSGSSIEELSGMLAKMQKTIAGAADGGKLQAEALDTIGLSAKKILELPIEEQFLVIGDAIQKIENPAQRSAAAMAVFGKSGATLNQIFADGSGAIRGAIADYQELAGMSDEFAKRADDANDAIATMKMGFGGLANVIAAAVAPALKEFAEAAVSGLRAVNRELEALTGEGLDADIIRTEKRLEEMKQWRTDANSVRKWPVVGRYLIGEEEMRRREESLAGMEMRLADLQRQKAAKSAESAEKAPKPDFNLGEGESNAGESGGGGTKGGRATTPYDWAFESAGARYNVDPDLLKAIASVETGGTFKPNLTSPKGAVGLMQFMPATAKQYGLTDRTDPYASINAGAKYMAKLLDQFEGDTSAAVAAYNAGEGAVGRRMVNGELQFSRLPKETQDYVPKVLARAKEYGGVNAGQRRSPAEDDAKQMAEAELRQTQELIQQKEQMLESAKELDIARAEETAARKLETAQRSATDEGALAQQEANIKADLATQKIAIEQRYNEESIALKQQSLQVEIDARRQELALTQDRGEQAQILAEIARLEGDLAAARQKSGDEAQKLALKESAAARDRLADIEKLRFADRKLIRDLEEQAKISGMTADEQARYSNLSRLSGQATADQKKRVEELSGEISKNREAAQGAANDYNKMGFTFASALEDAIISGKKFSDVLKSLQDDLVRMATRKLITEPLADIFDFDLGDIFGKSSSKKSGKSGSGESGGGGFWGDMFSGIGDIFGGIFDFFGGLFAEGGTAPADKISIVGEAGPELIIPRSPVEVIPLARAEAANAAEMFGGFFADGGFPEVGKISIVGERGPEIVAPAGATQVRPISQSQQIAKGGSAAIPKIKLVVDESAIHMTLGDWLERELASMYANRR